MSSKVLTTRTVFAAAVCLAFLHTVCCSENMNIQRREGDGESKTFGDAFGEFLSDLFESTSEPGDVASRQMNETTEDELKDILTNISQSLTSEIENESISDMDFITQSTSTTKETISNTTMTNRPGDVADKSTTVRTTTTTMTFSTTFPNQVSSQWQQVTTDDLYPEEDICYSDIMLKDFCLVVPSDMTDVTFWDLYSVLFSDTVIEALMMGCDKGSWCLNDRFDYWEALVMERVDMVMNSEISTSMCTTEVQSCIATLLDNFQECPVLQQMQFTADAFDLVCSLKQNAMLTSSCYRHVITALHITVADIMRNTDYHDETATEDKCSAPETEMTRGLICVANSCPGEEKAFQSFRPWSWFTEIAADLIESCNLDVNKCLALLQPPPGYIYGNDYATVIGVSVATMISTVMFTLTACLCYRRRRRNVVLKEGYQRLLNDEDQS